jgi:hypothetical protein
MAAVAEGIVSRVDQVHTTEEARIEERTQPALPHPVRPASNSDWSTDSGKVAIRNAAIQHMAGFPGRDSLSKNISIHRNINSCIRKPETFANWTGLRKHLQCRLEVMERAEGIARGLGLNPSKRNFELDTDEWKLLTTRKPELCETVSLYIGIFGEAGLFPKPPNFHPHDKGHWYLAIACAESGLKKEEINTRIVIAGISMVSTMHSSSFTYTDK